MVVIGIPWLLVLLLSVFLLGIITGTANSGRKR